MKHILDIGQLKEHSDGSKTIRADAKLFADLYDHYRLSYMALNFPNMANAAFDELLVVEKRLEEAIGMPEEPRGERRIANQHTGFNRRAEDAVQKIGTGPSIETNDPPVWP